MQEQHNKVKYSEVIIDNKDYGKRTIKFETGNLAKKAAGSVVVYLDQNTVLLSTTSISKSLKDNDLGFFPMTVDVEERMYAAGRIPGSFFRREGRPSLEAILACRLIDRSLRPNFFENFKNEIQIILTILAINPEDFYDVVAINAASLSVQLSKAPFIGPVAAIRMALLKDNKWIAFPKHSQLSNAVFNMAIAGRLVKDCDNNEFLSIVMLEAEATENCWNLIKNSNAVYPNEKAILQGIEQSKKFIKDIILAQLDLINKVKLDDNYNKKPSFYLENCNSELYEYVNKISKNDFINAFKIEDNQVRELEIEKIEINLFKKINQEKDELFINNNKESINKILSLIKKDIVRNKILKDKERIDKRSIKDIRNINAKINILPRVHGSAIFERGETQILGTTTLNMLRMEQQIDSLSPENSKRYMHNYNFPPYSTGEVGKVGHPKRREIGHGALAERAIIPVLPTREEFPYAIRQVSEALGSNGSTSMASVCASTLSLLHAGVPLKMPVAGISIGLITEKKFDSIKNNKYLAITDITGLEDAFGDMDFKIAGTSDFITAIQLDTKISILTKEILSDSLLQAKKARLHILKILSSVIDKPNKISNFAPKIIKLKIPADKIGSIIGPKGKNIKEIQDKTNADINIENDGTVYIGAKEAKSVYYAKDMIHGMTKSQVLKVGNSYFGKVVKIMNFGAFVSVTPDKDGLVHVSELRKLNNRRKVYNVHDLLRVGQKLHVSIINIDDRGKISLAPVLKNKFRKGE